MSRRSSVRTLVLAAALGAATACAASSTGPVDARLRRFAEGELQVTVDEIVGSFDPNGLTFARFTLTNVSARPLLVAGCIEGLAASIEREVRGAWQFVGGNWCWGVDPRHGFPLAPGASTEGAMQVPEPGRYRIVARFAAEAAREVAYDVASAPFDAR